MTKEQQRTLGVALCGYLPYGVKFKYFCPYDHENDRIGTIDGIDSLPNLHFFDENGSRGQIGKTCMPILRPLSDLTATITHNGESFIPIERLSKHFGNVGKCTLDSESGQLDETTTYGWTESYGDDYSGYSVAWNHEKNGFFVFYCEDVESIEEVDNTLYRVEYGYEVIDLLTEWKFDYRDLISQSLALSVHDLPENPYL